MAFDALTAFSRRARTRGWSRARALEDLEQHPATFNSMVKDGIRSVATDNDRLAKPYAAAFGSEYSKALTRAADTGHLSVSVRTAQELLGSVIRAAQDPDAPIELGQILPWRAIEDQLNAGPYPLPLEVSAAQLWDEITAACNRKADPRAKKAPRAATLLNEHVFAHTAAHSRHVMSETVDAGEDTVDPIQAAGQDSCWGADRAHSGRSDEVVQRVVELLVRRRSVDRTVARNEVVRAFADDYGINVAAAPLRKLVVRMLDDVLAMATRQVSINEAAAELSLAPAMDSSLVQQLVSDAFDRNSVEHPYDLSTEPGRSAYQRWIGVAAREALQTARTQHGFTCHEIQ